MNKLQAISGVATLMASLKKMCVATFLFIAPHSWRTRYLCSIEERKGAKNLTTSFILVLLTQGPATFGSRGDYSWLAKIDKSCSLFFYCLPPVTTS